MATGGALVAAMLVAGTCSLAGATVFYQQDFDGLSPGALAGQDGWYGAGGTVQSAVVVSGQAVRVTGGTLGRSNLFGVMPGNPLQRMEFDIRLDSDIYDFAGQSGIDIQHTLLFRGPNELGGSEPVQFAFVYKAGTDSTGAVVANSFEFRAGATRQSLPDGFAPVKDTWYHVIIDLDFGADTLDGAMTTLGGTVLWDPAIIAGLQNNGNKNNVNIDADGSPDVDFFLDNFAVQWPPPQAEAEIPEPVSAVLLGLGAAGALARRRRSS